MAARSSSIFSEKTLIPVSLLVTLGSVIFWTGSIAARLEAAEERLERAGSRERAMYVEFSQLHSQVAGIDQKVTTILELMQQDLKFRKR